MGYFDQILTHFSTFAGIIWDSGAASITDCRCWWIPGSQTQTQSSILE